MIIQSKQVWIAGQFLAMQLEVNDGKITDILPYGTKEADEDYGEKRILPGFIDVHPMELMVLIRMTPNRKDCVTG